MNAINNGGPAFPLKEPLSSDHEGMTLRDYFAAKAMQGFLTHEFGADAPSDKVAAWSYEMADAMLKARQLDSQQ